MIDAVPPSEASVRLAIAEGKCPFCGSGPWQMLPVHTNKKHGVDKWQLRDLAGLTTSEPLCDLETRAKMSRAAKLHPEAVLRATEASRAPGVKKNPRRTKAGRAKQRAHITRWAEQNADEIARLRSEFRQRMTTPAALAKWEASMARVRANREYTPEERAAFLERMQSPDVEAKRAAHREATKIEFCTEDGCDRPHVARGLCRMHWGRWRSAQNRRTRCVACGGPMDAERSTRKYCSPACKSRAARNG
jgi:hypothetical protein